MVEEIFLLVYIILSAVHIIGEVYEKITIRYITKPMLMPILLLFYVTATTTIWFGIISALICGCIGDILLMFKKEELFTFGLLSFLIGHIAYTATFVSGATITIVGGIAIIPYILTIAILYKFLSPGLEKMKGPVVVYMIVIMTMSYTSLLRALNLMEMMAFIVVIGTILFIVSDGIIAVNKFKREIPHAQVLIMITYLCGQFLIVYGMI